MTPPDTPAAPTTEEMVEELVFRCLDNQMAARIHDAKAALKQRVRDMERENATLREALKDAISGLRNFQAITSRPPDISGANMYDSACKSLGNAVAALRARLEQEMKEQ